MTGWYGSCHPHRKVGLIMPLKEPPNRIQRKKYIINSKHQQYFDKLQSNSYLQKSKHLWHPEGSFSIHGSISPEMPWLAIVQLGRANLREGDWRLYNHEGKQICQISHLNKSWDKTNFPYTQTGSTPVREKPFVFGSVFTAFLPKYHRDLRITKD